MASMIPERVTFLTSDDVTIVSDWYGQSSGSAPVAFLLHMMPADRTSWRVFAEALQHTGWNALAMDLRGHGESTQQNGKTISYKAFRDEEHQASQNDVDAAIQWLQNSQSVSGSRIIGIGASIGANLALQTLQKNTEMRGAVLLSPGLNYRGIQTLPLIRTLGKAQKVFIAASLEDQESFASAQQLHNTSPKQTVFQSLKNVGHGTTMLERDPELTPKILAWLKELLS